jgi:hypothetical protein
MAGAQPKTSYRSLFKQLDILPFPCQCALLSVNFAVNNQKIFKEIHLYTILIQAVNTIFVDQTST